MTSPVLANGLHRGFLQSSTRNDVKFAIMWANQDVGDCSGVAAGLAAPFLPFPLFPTTVE